LRSGVATLDWTGRMRRRQRRGSSCADTANLCVARCTYTIDSTALHCAVLCCPRKLQSSIVHLHLSDVPSVLPIVSPLLPFLILHCTSLLMLPLALHFTSTLQAPLAVFSRAEYVPAFLRDRAVVVRIFPTFCASLPPPPSKHILLIFWNILLYWNACREGGKEGCIRILLPCIRGRRVVCSYSVAGLSCSTFSGAVSDFQVPPSVDPFSSKNIDMSEATARNILMRVQILAEPAVRTLSILF
jgi:hypothetical protein